MSEIEGKYELLGGAGSFLGQPVDEERPTRNGRGRYRHYQGGSIYWSQAFPWEAFEVHGQIRDKWAALDWEQSPLGFPVSDEQPTGGGPGRIGFFQRGAIVHRPDLGTHEIHGEIHARWRAEGGLGGLGFPLTDELRAPDDHGRYNHFERGSIYWTPRLGAHAIPADLKDAWASGGWERGPLGYPVAGASRMPGVLTGFQDFEHGSAYAFGPQHQVVVRREHSFATSERLIGWEALGSALPDGDLVAATFAQSVPQVPVRVTLHAAPGVTGWKALALYSPGRGDLQEVFTEGQRTVDSMTIDPAVFGAGPMYLHFKKARLLGVHTGLYLLARADRLIGTHATFTWLRD